MEARFHQVLEALLSPDNERRQQAENVYSTAVESNPALTCSNLAQALELSGDVGVRSLAAVLLRQIMKANWDKIDGNTKSNVQMQLTRCLERETNRGVSTKICFVVIAEPKQSLSQRSDLVPWVLSIIKQRELSESKRASFVFLLGKLAEFSMPSLEKHLDETVSLLWACLEDKTCPEVQLASARAICNLLLSVSEPQKFFDFVEKSIPLMVNLSLNSLASTNLHDSASKTLEALGSLISKCMWGFDASLGQICTQLLEAASCVDLEDGGRVVALTLLTEIFERRGKRVSQDDSFMSKCTQALLCMQWQDEEWEQDWSDDQQPSEFDILEITQPGIRGSALHALGLISANVSDNQKFLGILFDMVTNLLNNQGSDWLRIHAAITTIGLVAESQGKDLEPVIGKVVGLIHPFFNHSHVRVRYAVCATVHELLRAENLKGEIQIKYHQAILPGLIQIIRSQGPPALKSCACHAVGAFMNPEVLSGNHQAILASYITEVIGGLVNALETGTLNVKEDAMTALGRVAKVAGSEFGAFYDQLVPGIKTVMSRSTTDEASGLRSAAMSCIASIAEAVGKERFAPDAPEVMRLLLTGLATNANNGNSSSSLIELDGVLDFSKRVCAVLVDDFVPYLPHVLPALLMGVQIDLNVKIEDAGDMDGEAAKTEENGNITLVHDIHGQGAYKISANIFAFQTKQNALDAIDSIAETLGARFAPYLEQTAKVVLPAIGDRLHVSASIVAAEAGASLVHCACKALHEAGQSMEPAVKLLVAVSVSLLTGLEDSSDVKDADNDDGHEKRVGFASAFERCMRICWFSGGEENNEDGSRPAPRLRPPADLVPKMATVLRDAIIHSTERRINMRSNLQENGFEDETIEKMLEELNEEENDLMTNLVDSIGYMIKLFGSDFVPVFDQLIHPVMSVLLRPEQPSELNFGAVCLYDDMIQYCGPSAHKYLELCFPAMIQYSQNDDLLLRQAALYGIGQVAEHAPNHFKQAAKNTNIAKILVDLIEFPDAKSEEYIDATENAISVLGKICDFHSDVVDAKSLLPIWLNNLPLLTDEEESQYSHRLLCKFIQRGNPSIVAPEQLPQVVNVLSGILVGGACGGSNGSAEIADVKTQQIIPELLRGIRKSIPEQEFQSIYKNLEPPRQNALRNALN